MRRSSLKGVFLVLFAFGCGGVGAPTAEQAALNGQMPPSARSQMQLQARCGDGVVQDGEECDDGNNRNHDGCTEACSIEGEDEGYTPDGGTGGGDDGGGDGGGGIPVCGNGIIEEGETCDDGNAVCDDGCDGHCQLEEDVSRL